MNCLWQIEMKGSSTRSAIWRALTLTSCAVYLFLLFQESMFRFTVSLHCDRLFMLPLCSGRILKCQQQQQQQQQHPSVEHKRLRKNFLKTKSMNKTKIPIELNDRNRSLSVDYFVSNRERSFPSRWSHVNFICCMCCSMFRFFFSLSTE